MHDTVPSNESILGGNGMKQMSIRGNGTCKGLHMSIKQRLQLAFMTSSMMPETYIYVSLIDKLQFQTVSKETLQSFSTLHTVGIRLDTIR